MHKTSDATDISQASHTTRKRDAMYGKALAVWQAGRQAGRTEAAADCSEGSARLPHPLDGFTHSHTTPSGPACLSRLSRAGLPPLHSFTPRSLIHTHTHTHTHSHTTRPCHTQHERVTLRSSLHRQPPRRRTPAQADHSTPISHTLIFRLVPSSLRLSITSLTRCARARRFRSTLRCAAHPQLSLELADNVVSPHRSCRLQSVSPLSATQSGLPQPSRLLACRYTGFDRRRASSLRSLSMGR